MPLPSGPLTPTQVFHLLKLVPNSRPASTIKNNFAQELAKQFSSTTASNQIVTSGSQNAILSAMTRQSIFLPLGMESASSAAAKNSTDKSGGKNSNNRKDKRKKAPAAIN